MITTALTDRSNIIKESSFNIFDSKVYINALATYYAYYGVIPSYKRISGIDHYKATKWIASSFNQQTVQQHQKEYYDSHKKRMECENVLYLLDNDILIDIQDNGIICVVHQKENESKAQEIVDNMKRFKRKRKPESKIHVITNYGIGLDIRPIKCPKPKMQLNKNYNDDLQMLHKDIVRLLSVKNKSGLFLFHGQPGTGKSTYIRHLVNNIKKKFIFLSPRLAGSLDAPNFISLLIENRNSVLIIEDAEELLGSREKTNNSAISMLLNLTDGLLGESLGIQTICTFNTQVQNIDEALMRKGRLMAMYEFKPLAPVKANLLLKDIGAGIITYQPMSLSEIYNTDKKGFSLNPGKNQIGFKVA